MTSPTSPNDTNFILYQQLAQEYLDAARLLLKDNSMSAHQYFGPALQLLGISIELSLKGFISIAGIQSGANVPKSHDLQALLKRASKSLSFPELSDDEKAGLAMLNNIYNSPFVLRYPQLGHHKFPNAKSLEGAANRLSSSLDQLAHCQDMSDSKVRERLGVVM